MDRMKKIRGVTYAMTQDGVPVPVLDITHPLFLAALDANLYRDSLDRSENPVKNFQLVPVSIQKIISANPYLKCAHHRGMKTVFYRLGPHLTKDMQLGYQAMRYISQGALMGLRYRLRELCQQQAASLLPLLKAEPLRNLCFFNIGGGASSDSINTLILIHKENPKLLQGRKIEINVLDIDTYCTAFAKNSVEALKRPGGYFYRLDISLNIVAYDWETPEPLVRLVRDKTGWIQVFSSEGGLFEYGSDWDILRTLKTIAQQACGDAIVAGSMLWDSDKITPGYLDFIEPTNLEPRLLGRSALDKMSADFSGTVERISDINKIYLVFTMRPNAAASDKE